MCSLAADVLGSPDLPKSALDKKISPIRIYESLYQRYSRLHVSRDTDRPLAIAALEARLLHAFNTAGGYGVFELISGPEPTMAPKLRRDDAQSRIATTINTLN